MTKAFSPCSQGTKSLENTNMHVNASLCCEQRFKKQTSQQRQIHSTVGTQRSSQLEDGDSGALLKENEKKKKNYKSLQFGMGFPGDADGKEPACNQGDLHSIPELRRSSGGGHGNHSSILAWSVPMDRGIWRAIGHGVAKSRTLLS